MKSIFPAHLKKGDEIRVIAPSRTLAIIAPSGIALAKKRLMEMGFSVSFGKNVYERDKFDSSSIESRIEDIHEAFRDPNVKGILTVVGGYNSNQLLDRVDYSLIKKNPKVLCGFSDITALQNAIFTKTGLVTYSGPHFSTFGMEQGIEFYIEFFKKAVIDAVPYSIVPSASWSDDVWFMNQSKRKFIENKGMRTIFPGEAMGAIIGGNLCTFNLLQGTSFIPSLAGKVLFIEDDEDSKVGNFDRNLQSLIHQPGFEKVRALIFGRFQKESNISEETLKVINKTKLNEFSIFLIY